LVLNYNKERELSIKLQVNLCVNPILWHFIMRWIIFLSLDIRGRRSRSKRWRDKLLWNLDRNQGTKNNGRSGNGYHYHILHHIKVRQRG
jgi:hypothetical protein